jgi:hypothetical protein
MAHEAGPESAAPIIALQKNGAVRGSPGARPSSLAASEPEAGAARAHRVGALAQLRRRPPARQRGNTLNFIARHCAAARRSVT